MFVDISTKVELNLVFRNLDVGYYKEPLLSGNICSLMRLLYKEIFLYYVPYLAYN